MIAKEMIRNNLKFLVRVAGFSRQKFAYQIGVKAKTLNAYLEGRATPNIETLIKVVDLLGISLDDIARRDVSKAYKITPHTTVTAEAINE